MRPNEYATLLSDIRERGIRVPIEVHGDVVLDGRHRLRAAKELGLEQVPVVDVALGGEGPVDYLLKAAVLRRHLTDDQRALIAARYAAKNPKPRGGDRRRTSAGTNGDHVGPFDHRGRREAARTLNVAPGRVKKARTLLAAAPFLADQVHHGELKLSEALRRVRRAEQLRLIDQAPLPDGTFHTIVADPPWQYEDSGCQGAAERHYPTISVEEICALPVGERAAPQSHLYLWTTAPMLPEAFRVLAAWGFTYVTTLVWRKPRLGLGRYFRSVTEFVLFGVKGKLPLRANNLPNLFEAPIGRHSEKPGAFFELVQRASPGAYLELFARRHRPGWTCWGAEVDSEPTDQPAGGPGDAIHSSTPEVKPGAGEP